MQIAIIGTGYVGLVTGACFAEMGHSVMCLDIDPKKIQNLQQGLIPIFEPGLEELVKRNLLGGRLRFTTNYQEAIRFGLICFLAVPTPSQESGACDISYIESAAKELASHLEEYRVIVNKSTVPVGTAFRVKEILKEELKKEIGKSLSTSSPIPNSSKKGPPFKTVLSRTESS